tara:strand:+ start:300 stop:737 length:438 start_codon:yes stop_codon:yes gene_type:complete
MIKEVRHIGIVVSNMKKSLEFYHELLGLKIIRDMNEKGDYLNNMLSLKDVEVRTVKLSANDQITLVELLEFQSHNDDQIRNFYTIGTSHLAFTVDNLQKTYEYLLKNNVKFTSPPQLPPDGYAKVTFCEDPDGTPIELVEVINSS